MMCAPGSNARVALGLHLSRRWKGAGREAHDREWDNRSTRRARRLAEDAEHDSLGRGPRARTPLLSIHAFKVFVGPAERSLRRAPRPRSALRALRVSLLPCHVPL